MKLLKVSLLLSLLCSLPAMAIESEAKIEQKDDEQLILSIYYNELPQEYERQIQEGRLSERKCASQERAISIVRRYIKGAPASKGGAFCGEGEYGVSVNRMNVEILTPFEFKCFIGKGSLWGRPLYQFANFKARVSCKKYKW